MFATVAALRRTALRGLQRALRRIQASQGLKSPPEDEGTAPSNIAFNRYRWGQAGFWLGKDAYGYQWGGGVRQTNSSVTTVAEKWLLPHVGKRRDLKILEIAPGAGRFTTELVRLSRELHLVDLNEVCIDLCRERFKYYPAVKLYVNDGLTCDIVPDADFDLIASYDSMVHMTPDVIGSYVRSCTPKLVPGGLLWLDHSGKGLRDSGHRTAMTKERMAEIAQACGLEVIDQPFRNDHDCISILRRSKA